MREDDDTKNIKKKASNLKLSWATIEWAKRVRLTKVEFEGNLPRKEGNRRMDKEIDSPCGI